MNMTHKVTVLIIEDEKKILTFVSKILKKHDYKVLCADTGKGGLSLIGSQCPDIILLDLGLPDLDGCSIIQEVRAWSSIPIIVISARSAEKEKVAALDLGADDYITKPYNPLEVVARIKAQLRRNYDYREETRQTREVLCLRGLQLCEKEGTVELDGRAVELTSTEFKILKLFMGQPGRIFTKQQIFESVWEDSYAGDDNTVMVHISNLRGKLEQSGGQPPQIKTVKGLGYKMERET